MKIDLSVEQTPPYAPDAAHQRLGGLAGAWEGEARTFVEPGKPAVEARWEGTVTPLLGGRFARLEYRSRFGDKPLAGEMLVAFDSGEGMWRTAWIDSFHTGTGLIASEGQANEGPIRVTGRYFAAPGHPHWGWRTELHDDAPGVLTVRMFNITPEGEESLGVEVALRRRG